MKSPPAGHLPSEAPPDLLVRRARRVALSTAAWFLLFSVLWILLSDHLLLWLVQDFDRFARLQTLKGWFYVTLVAVILFFLLRASVLETLLAERETAQSEARFRLAVEAYPGPLMILSHAGRILFINRAGARLARRAPEFLLGREVEQVLPAEFLRQSGDCLRAALRGEPGLSEVRLEGESEPRELELRFLPVFDRPGEVHQVLCIGHDMTAIREARRQLESANRDLEQRVAERTRDLEGAIRDLEGFAASVSHDLRGPLRSISGYAGMLHEAVGSSLAPDHRRLLDQISRGCQRMGRLIRDLLEYSRLERKGGELAPVSLVDCFQTLREETAERVAQSGARVMWPKNPPFVLGNASLLFQVFGNLLDNALTYTRPEKAPEVEITWTADEDTVRVEVGDRGPGIDPKYHERIFQPFERLHADPALPGTGIGLTNARKSASLLGGELRVAERAGGGTVFSVTLRRAAGGESAGQAAPLAGMAPQAD
ncbi:MAG: PAS domain-containing sensor histidine kinase [Puniceicoccaceae bacterium]|nr:MAG: PAS domain-containing sensor histidine kinase [Puniceicoccaceae bacterium]